METETETDVLTPRGVDCFNNEVVEVPESLNLDNPASTDTNNWIIVTKKTGHRHISWLKNDPITTAAARIIWEKFIENGMEPFKVGKNGKATGTKLTEFDAEILDVIFMPKKALVGG